MASTKLLGKKREKLIYPEFESELKEDKEDSTQSSNLDYPYTVQYFNYDPKKIPDSLCEVYSSKNVPINNRPKLSDFKVTKFYDLSSKKTEKLAPYKSKSSNFNELDRNEKEYLYHFLKYKNYSINELKQINLLKKIPEKKFHMILDIDSTMIKAVDRNEVPSNPKPDDFEIRGSIDRNTFEFYCRYRPYLFHFIHELKDYFNFYISTLGHINYANKIIDDLIKKAGISIPDINIVSNINPGQKLVKSLSEIKAIANFKEELNETVIIDDIVNYWIKPPIVTKEDDEIKQCIKCLIPSKRYVINSAKGTDKDNFGILLHRNILEEGYKKDNNYSIPIEYSFCIEKDNDSENGKKGQFFYLEMFLKNCIKFCLYTEKPLVEAMDFLRKKVFENCKFNLNFLDSSWIYNIIDIIKELGGVVVKPDEVDITTHYVVKDEIIKEKIPCLKQNQNVVNVNYIFKCYFNLYRMNELENQAFYKGKK